MRTQGVKNVLRYALFSWVFFSFLFSPFSTDATITPLISYQAKLTDTNNVAVADGAVTVKFRIYSVSSGGSALYAEQQSVTTTNGLFTALIGSGTLIESSGALSAVNFNQDPLYLGVQVGSDSEMTPRKRIASSVFAFNADKVGGKSETEFALLAGRGGGQTLNGGTVGGENLILNSTASATKGKIFFGANSAYDEVNSRLGVGTSTPSSRLVIQGFGNTSATSALDVTNASTTSLLFVRDDGNVGIGTASPATALNIVRSGSSANTVVAVATYNNSNVSVFSAVRARGTSASPSGVQTNDTLGVYGFGGWGTGSVAFSTSTTGRFIGVADENWTNSAQGTGLQFLVTPNGSTTPSTVMKIANTGRVGIGTTSPAYPLTVVRGDNVNSAAVTAITYASSLIGASPNSVFALVGSRGTEASPSAVQNGDDLGNLIFTGYGATAFGTEGGAAVHGIATGNWTDSSQPAELRFLTTAAGTSTDAVRMVISDSGNVGIATDIPSSFRLQVAGNVGPNASGFNLGSASLPWQTLHVFNSNGNGIVAHNDTTNVEQVALGFAGVGHPLIAASSTQNFFQITTRNGGQLNSGIQIASSTGNVGIGGSFFGSRLVVQGVDNTSGNSALNVTNASSTALLFVRNDGNVGIGTTVPSAALQIVRDGQEAGAIVSGFGNGSNDYGALYLARARGTVAIPSAVQFGNTLGRLHFAGYDGVASNQIGATIEAGAFENWSSTNRGTSLTFSTTANASTTVVARMVISDKGDVGIGTVSPGSRLDVYNATSTSNLAILRVLSDVTSTANVVFRVDSEGDIFTDGSTTLGTPADVAEKYVVLDSSVTVGDIVSLSPRVLEVGKSEKSYDEKMLGIVSGNPGVILAGNLENGLPIALSGRVPVKISLENGPIQIGDPITSSDVPGVGMRATKSGRIIGYALENFDGNNRENTVLVFVNLGYHLSDEVFGGDNGSAGEGFISTLKSALASLSGVVRATGTWVFDQIETAFFKANYVRVENGITLKDKDTGEYYCITLQYGEITKTKGDCETIGAQKTQNVSEDILSESNASSSDEVVESSGDSNLSSTPPSTMEVSSSNSIAGE